MLASPVLLITQQRLMKALTLTRRIMADDRSNYNREKADAQQIKYLDDRRHIAA